MEYKEYDLAESLARMTSILEKSGDEYSQVDFVPKKEELEKNKGGFVNGVAIACRLIFEAGGMPLLTIARIYDMYMGEAEIIMKSNPQWRDVIIDGHIIRGLYNAENDNFFNELLDVGARLITLADVINAKIGRKNNKVIRASCAIDLGKCFYYNTNSGLKIIGNLLTRTEDIVRKSDNINVVTRGMYISENVLNRLKESYKSFFKPVPDKDKLYNGIVENIGMARWIKEQE